MSYPKPFDKNEYEQHVKKVKLSMQSTGFDLLIC